MKKQEKLTVKVMVPKGDGYVDYNTLTEEEKEKLAISVRKRIIRSIARKRGLEVHFYDEQDGIVTA